MVNFSRTFKRFLDGHKSNSHQILDYIVIIINTRNTSKNLKNCCSLVHIGIFTILDPLNKPPSYILSATLCIKVAKKVIKTTLFLALLIDPLQRNPLRISLGPINPVAFKHHCAILVLLAQVYHSLQSAKFHTFQLPPTQFITAPEPLSLPRLA